MKRSNMKPIDEFELKPEYDFSNRKSRLSDFIEYGAQRLYFTSDKIRGEPVQLN